MPPRTTTWPLDPHTKGKHMVLKHYMGALLPILTSWNGRVLFIDAFAGPGEYSNGEPGSPVIALQALIDHRDRDRIRSEVNYFFIEKDEARSKHLEEALGELQPSLPPNCNYEVINSTFDETLSGVLDNIDQQNARLAPAFVMIDPFGVSETPMSTIGRILKNPQSEVYISFMYRDINRFREHPNFERHLDELFGCSRWRQGIDLAEGKERKDFFYSLYKDQLKANGAKYVVHFELYEAQQLVYAIFFGTQQLKGCDKMKQAIWKVAPFGDFRFRGSQLSQFVLGEGLVDLSLLEKALQEQFRSRGWQKIEDVEDFVKSDATGFHSGHLKRKTLTPMEKNGKIEVERPPGRSKAYFSDGTRILFL